MFHWLSDLLAGVFFLFFFLKKIILLKRTDGQDQSTGRTRSRAENSDKTSLFKPLISSKIEEAPVQLALVVIYIMAIENSFRIMGLRV